MWYSGEETPVEKGKRIAQLTDGVELLKHQIKATQDFLGKNTLDLKFGEDEARQLKQAYNGFNEDDTKPARHKYYAKMAGMESWLAAQPDLDLTPQNPNFIREALPFIADLRTATRELISLSSDPGLMSVQNDFGLVESGLIQAERAKPNKELMCTLLERAQKRLTIAGETIREVEQACREDFANGDAQAAIMAYREQQRFIAAQAEKEAETERRRLKNLTIAKGREEGYMWYDDSPIVPYPRDPNKN